MGQDEGANQGFRGGSTRNGAAHVEASQHTNLANEW
jgi:hypothetical protein